MLARCIHTANRRLVIIDFSVFSEWMLTTSSSTLWPLNPRWRKSKTTTLSFSSSTSRLTSIRLRLQSRSCTTLTSPRSTPWSGKTSCYLTTPWFATNPGVYPFLMSNNFTRTSMEDFTPFQRAWERRFILSEENIPRFDCSLCNLKTVMRPLDQFRINMLIPLAVHTLK